MTSDAGTLLLPIGILAAVLGGLLVGQLRRYALARNLLDEVNERSSHNVPTPRGGGMGIVGVALPFFALAALIGFMPFGLSIGLFVAGFIIVATGWIDDHGHVAAPLRLIAHFAAACVLMLSIGRFPLGWIGLGIPALEIAFTLIMIAWFVNLFNFMDGIDGIAGSEAIVVLAGYAAICLALGAGVAFLSAAVVIAAATVGFLWWNWPPARIFMGDAGSGFLGLVLASAALVAAQSGEEFGVAMLVLPAVFVADATITVIRRALSGARIFEAHRSHAYQVLSRRAGSHLKVTTGVIAVNVLFLLPVALAVATALVPPLIGVLIAYAPLIAAGWWLGAGDPEA